MSQFALPTHHILIIVFLGYHTCQYTITWENGLNSVTDTCVDFDPFPRLSAAIRPEKFEYDFLGTIQYEMTLVLNRVLWILSTRHPNNILFAMCIFPSKNKMCHKNDCVEKRFSKL